MLRAEVLADGSVGEVKVVEKWSDPRYVGLSVKAIKAWTFEPERIDGTPIFTWVQIPIVFRPNGSPMEPAPWFTEIPQATDLPLAENSPIEWLSTDES